MPTFFRCLIWQAIRSFGKIINSKAEGHGKEGSAGHILLLVQLTQDALYIPDKNGGILNSPKRSVVLQLPTPSGIGE